MNEVQLSELPELSPTDFSDDNLILIRRISDNRDYKSRVSSLKGLIVDTVGSAAAEGLPTLIGRDNLEQTLLDEIDYIALSRDIIDSQNILIEQLDTDLTAAVESFGLTTGGISQQVDDLIAEVEFDRQETADGFVAVADRLTIIENTGGGGGGGSTTVEVQAVVNAVNDPDTGLVATRSTLFNEYRTETDSDSAITSAIESVRADVFDPDTNIPNSAFIGRMDTALVNSGGAIATALTDISATVADEVSAAIGSNYYTVAQADSAIAAAESRIEAVLNDPSTGLAATRSTIQNDYYTSTAADQAIAAGVLALESQIFDPATGDLTTSFASTVESAVSGADGSALATRVGSLEAEVDNLDFSSYATQTDVNQAISTESSARSVEIANSVASINTSLNSRITSEINNVEDLISDETGARGAAINSINTSIRNDLGGDIISARAFTTTSVQTAVDGLNSSIASIGTTASNADEDASAALTLATTANGKADSLVSDIDDLQAQASLVVSASSGGRSTIAGVVASAGASTSKLDFIGDNIRFLDSSGNLSVAFNSSINSHQFLGRGLFTKGMSATWGSAGLHLGIRVTNTSGGVNTLSEYSFEATEGSDLIGIRALGSGVDIKSGLAKYEFESGGATFNTDLSVTGTISNFTGSHVFTSTNTFTEGDLIEDSNVVIQDNNNAIGDGELTTTANSKRVLGTFSKMKEDGTLLTNAVGEATINVVNQGGDIQAGDLLVSSDIAGKAMKQADDLVRNYTVAKARQDYTFQSGDTDVKIACILMCG